MADDAGWGAPVDVADNAPPPPTGGGWGAPVAEAATPEEGGWGPPVKAEPPPADPRGPMPSPWAALTQGAGAGLREAVESGKTVAGQTPTAQPETSPAAQGLEWGDVLSPYGKLLPKVTYGLGKSAPTLAAGVAGGAAGTAVAGPVGTLAGGALGAAVGAAFQTIGPVFADELKKSPNDPDGAWSRAEQRAAAEGLFSGAGWAAFGLPLRAVMGPLKSVAFQALGIQPGIAVTGQAAQNVIQGKPAGEDLGQAYAQGAAGTAVPMAGHAALTALLPRRGAAPTGPSPTSQTAMVGRAQSELAGLQGDHAVLSQQHQNEIAQYGAKSPEAMETEQAVHANLRDQHTASERVRYAQLGRPEEGPSREVDFAAPVPGQGPDPSTWTSGPFWGAMNRTSTRWKKTFQPEEISDLSLQAAGIIREYGSASRGGKDSIHHGMDKFHNEFEHLSTQESIDYIKAASRQEGLQVPKDLQQSHNLFRKLLDMIDRGDRDAGSKMGFLQDYFPFMYKDPKTAADWLNTRLAGMTKAGFQKKRSIEFLQDALDQGLELVTYNPADLVTMRLTAGMELQERVRLLRRINQYLGAAAPIKNEGQQAAARSAGWHLIKDPTGQQWAMHPDLKPIWDNTLGARGLWDDPTAAGNIFRNWMKLKNFYVQPKLGFSLFHPLHVSHINVNDGFTRGWMRLSRSGDPLGMLHEVAKGFYGQLLQGTPGLSTEAKRARGAWQTPIWERTKEQNDVVKLMNRGGFSPQLSEELRTYDSRKMKDAIINQQWFKVLPYALRQIIPLITRPFFEHWIPNLKTAAYLDGAKELFGRRPDLIDDYVNGNAALGTIAKSIDNRYGEMFYKNLMWNKTLKEAGIASFLSLGWNGGFVREFGGGVLEPFIKNAIDQTPTRKAISDAKSKTAFAFFYMFSAALLNAATSVLKGGVSPQDLEPMDYFLPRIGGKNPDDSPRRISNMFYTREIPMVQKHIEEKQSVFGGLRATLWNKMMFEPIYEFYNNKDYYGFNIMDENAPWYKRAYQGVMHVLGDTFTPITITGAKRALQLDGKWNEEDSNWEKIKKLATEPESGAAFLGFGPAPSYASKSSVVNRINYLFERYVAPQERPQAMKENMEARHDARLAIAAAKQAGDGEKLAQATVRLQKLMGTSKMQTSKLTSDRYMFSRLPYSEQIDLLRDLPPADFKHYWPNASKMARGNKEMLALARAYYGPQP